MTARARQTIVEIPYEVRIRWELWESLLSMVRVYANAAALTHGEFVVTVLSDAAWVQHNGGLLALRLSVDDGTVHWKLKDPAGTEQRRQFELLESGVLLAQGEETELDRAAIDWLEELTSAAARRQAS
jgi:hypothetical protein